MRFYTVIIETLRRCATLRLYLIISHSRKWKLYAETGKQKKIELLMYSNSWPHHFDWSIWRDVGVIGFYPRTCSLRRWRQYVPPKRWYPRTSPQGITIQKTSYGLQWATCLTLLLLITIKVLESIGDVRGSLAEDEKKKNFRATAQFIKLLIMYLSPMSCYFIILRSILFSDVCPQSPSSIGLSMKEILFSLGSERFTTNIFQANQVWEFAFAILRRRHKFPLHQTLPDRHT
jgi:hypothetical protein